MFLSLVLMILISVLFTVMEAARTNGKRFQMECVSDMALQSALAEYNVPMLEQFDLFFLDTDYGSSDHSGRLEEHIKGYMNHNFKGKETKELFFLGRSRDLYRLEAGDIEILKRSGAADLSGEIVERAAVDYMLDRYGALDVNALEKNQREAKEKGLLDDTMEKRRKENEIDLKKNTPKRKKKRIPLNNPADNVNSLRGSKGLLSMVTGEKEISAAYILPEEVPTGREYIEEDGYIQGESAPSLSEDLLFQKYLMEKCGNFVEQKEHSKLKYEMEYLLMGKSSDQENLKSVVARLLAIREASNFLYIMSNGEMKAEAEAMAAALAVVLLFPHLQPFLKLSLLIAWSYAESVNDVKILLDGGSIPLMKTEASWHLSLKKALKLKLSSKEKEKEDKGLNYQGYLHILLAGMKKETRNLRFLDIIEMDVRQIEGYERFQIDHCIHDFEVRIAAGAGGRSEMELTRTVGYQK